MSEVWLARRRQGSQTPLVVKWVLPHLAHDATFAQMLLNEARVAARLNHPNLPRVTDHFIEPSGRQYLVMDYINGEDLRQILNKEEGRPLPGALFDLHVIVPAATATVVVTATVIARIIASGIVVRAGIIG